MVDGRKIVNIRLDPDLWRKAKAQAAMEGKTLQEYLEALLTLSADNKIIADNMRSYWANLNAGSAR